MECALVQVGEDGFLICASDVFYWQRNIILMPNSITSVEKFIEYLNANESFYRPVEKLHIAAHSNEYSSFYNLNIYEFEKWSSARVLSYIRGDSDCSGRIKLSDQLRKNSSGEKVPLTIYIYGCQIGKCRKFIQALKEEFDATFISAPKHYNYFIDFYLNKKLIGIIEFYKYSEFKIYSLSKIEEKDVLVDLLIKQDFKFLDETEEVPSSFWDDKIPFNIKKNKRKKYAPKIYLGDNAPRNKTDEFCFRNRHGRIWRHDVYRYSVQRVDLKDYFVDVEIKEFVDANKDLDYSQKKQKIKEKLLAHDLGFFSNSSWLPEWERYGFDSMDSFMDGYTWVIGKRKKRKTKKIVDVCKGVRHIYEITPNIVRKSDSSLYYNFYANPNITNPEDNQINLNRFTEEKLFLTL